MVRTVVFERFGRVAPLGIRFVNASGLLPIKSGLSVRAYPQITPDIQFTLHPSTSGVYTLHKLPGLKEFLNSAGTDEDWENVPRQDYTVTVDDLRNRYLSCQFTASVPHRWKFSLDCITFPPEAPQDAVALYPLSNRTILSNRAQVQAELYDADNDTPAKWAFVEIQYEGDILASGITDERGRIILDFAYPEIVADDIQSPPSGGSPPSDSQTNLTDQSWSVTIAVHYAQPTDTQTRFDICSTRQQPSVDVWSEWSGTVEAGNGITQLPEQTLRFGEPLVLRTTDIGASPIARPLPVLYVTA